MNITLQTFKSNPIFGMLFPEFVIPRNQARFIVPCRTRSFPEDTVTPKGVGGSGAGDHFDLAILDDIVSEQDIDGTGASGADMLRKKAWFDLVEESILQDQKNARMGVIGTRYAVDDVYQPLFDDLRVLIGYPHPGFEEKGAAGKWDIYYRKAIEDEEVIFPEAFTKERFEKMAQNKWWLFQTQYMNDPQESGMSEFKQFDLKKCLVWEDEKSGEWYIRREVDEVYGDKEDEGIVRLGACDVVMAVDPASTDKKVTSRHSRTAIEIWAMDSKERAYLIWSRVGHYSILRTFDLIFEGCQKFDGYVRSVVVESNAMQKIIAPLLNKESRERDYYISPKPIPASGDKDARIRSNVGRFLMRGLLYVAQGEGLELIEEKNVFPMSEFKKDALDAAEKALVELKKPFSEEEYMEMEIEEEIMQFDRDEVTGYSA
jgi:hypothetical protein